MKQFKNILSGRLFSVVVSFFISLIIIFFLVNHYKETKVSSIIFDVPTTANMYPFEAIRSNNPLSEKFIFPGGGASYIDLFMATYSKHINHGVMYFTLEDENRKILVNETIPLSSLNDNQYLNINFPYHYLKEGVYYFTIKSQKDTPKFTIWLTKTSNNCYIENFKESSAVFNIGSTSVVSLKELLQRMNQFHPYFLPYEVTLISLISFIYLSVFFIFYTLFGKSKSKEYIYLLLLLILILILKNIVWANIFPMWQTPDEPAFYSYTESIVMEKNLPTVNVYANNYNNLSREVNTAYNDIFSNLLHNNFTTENFDQNYYKYYINKVESIKGDINARINPAGNYVEGNPPLFFSYEAVPYVLFFKSSIITRFFMMRMFSSLLSIINVVFIFLIFKELFNNKKLSLLLAFATMMQPMFSMISISITSQNMINMLFTIFIYYLIIFYKQLFGDKVKRKTILILGIVTALGLLTKAQMFVAPIILISVIIYYIVKNKKFNIRFMLMTCILYFIPILLIYGWWAIFSYIHYHTLYGTVGVTPLNPINNLSLSKFLLNIADNIPNSNVWASFSNDLWANFGWLDTYFNAELYNIIGYLLIIVIIGNILFYIKKVISLIKKTPVREHFMNVEVYCLLVISFIYVLALLLLIDYEWIKTVSPNDFLQGQYYLVVIAPIMAIIFVGIYSILNSLKFLQNRRTIYILAYMFVIAGLVFNISSILLVVNRYYL